MLAVIEFHRCHVRKGDIERKSEITNDRGKRDNSVVDN